MLTNQISSTVESKFELDKTESSDGEYNEQVKQIIKTYSNVTLNKTEQLTISREPDAQMLLYIKRSDADEIFKQRKQKIKTFCNYAEGHLKKRRISDAIKYYYWAYTLLQTHPDKGQTRHTDKKGEKHQLSMWLPERIKQIMSDINVRVKDENTDDEGGIYGLDDF